MQLIDAQLRASFECAKGSLNYFNQFERELNAESWNFEKKRQIGFS